MGILDRLDDYPALKDVLVRGAGVGNTLYQTEWWTTAEGDRIRLDEMERQHRRNLKRWLLARAERLHDDWLWWECIAAPEANGDMAQMGLDQAFDDLMEQDATEWLRSTPFFRRLDELAPDPKQVAP